MKTIILDGNKINDLDSFYDEVQRKFCPDLPGFGRNLNAFNDVLRGGFGVFKDGEHIKLIWQQSNESVQQLGYESTVNYFKHIRLQAHPTNYDSIDKRIAEASAHRGPTLFDELLAVFKNEEHKNRIQLVLE